MTRDARPYRRIGIIGTGRVATAIGLALADHSAQPLLLWGRNRAHRAAAVATIGRADGADRIADVATTCDLVAIAVSDDAIEQSVLELAASAPAPAPAPAASPFAFHLSGRSGAALLSPLRDKGWMTAAIHPAMTFTGDAAREVAAMAGARFAVTGSTDRANSEARGIVARLGGVAVDVAEERRPLYHAALCHGANHLVTLVAGSCDALAVAGVEDPAALLAPLVRAALENSLAQGMEGLSGPLLRGDAATIKRHLSALRRDRPALLPSYRAMAMATLDALDALEGQNEDASPSPCRSVLEDDQ